MVWSTCSPVLFVEEPTGLVEQQSVLLRTLRTSLWCYRRHGRYERAVVGQSFPPRWYDSEEEGLAGWYTVKAAVSGVWRACW